MQFGKILASAMREKSLNQAALAAAAGISQGAISRYLNGKSAPRAEELRKISDVLEIPMEQLLTGEITESKRPPSRGGDKKSGELSSHAERLDRLRIKTDATWAEVAEETGLSESMIYQVRSGARQLSSKAEHRLSAAERKAGLASPLVHTFRREAEPTKQWEIFGKASTLEQLALLKNVKSEPGLWSLWFEMGLAGVRSHTQEHAKKVEYLSGLALKLGENPDSDELRAELVAAATKIIEEAEDLGIIWSDHFDLMMELGSLVRKGG